MFVYLLLGLAKTINTGFHFYVYKYPLLFFAFLYDSVYNVMISYLIILIIYTYTSITNFYNVHKATLLWMCLPGYWTESCWKSFLQVYQAD